jgi:hypothetical protein
MVNHLIDFIASVVQCLSHRASIEIVMLTKSQFSSIFDACPDNSFLVLNRIELKDCVVFFSRKHNILILFFNNAYEMCYTLVFFFTIQIKLRTFKSIIAVLIGKV